MKNVFFAIAMFLCSYFAANGQNKITVDTLFLQSGDTLVGVIEKSDDRFVYFKQNNGTSLRVNRGVVLAEKNAEYAIELKDVAIDYSRSLNTAAGFFIIGNLMAGTGIAVLTIGLLKPKTVVVTVTVPSGPGFQGYSYETEREVINKPMIYSGMGLAALGGFLNVIGAINLTSGSKTLNNKNASVLEYDIYGTSASVRLRF